jgi:hypothetical protein
MTQNGTLDPDTRNKVMKALATTMAELDLAIDFWQRLGDQTHGIIDTGLAAHLPGPNGHRGQGRWVIPTSVRDWLDPALLAETTGELPARGTRQVEVDQMAGWLRHAGDSAYVFAGMLRAQRARLVEELHAEIGPDWQLRIKRG